jgi:hypothetical protein
VASFTLGTVGSPLLAGVRFTMRWIGFPVGYAVSGVLLTVFGYFAMIL